MDILERDTDKYLKVLEEAIYSNPTPLLQIKNDNIITYINDFMPYSHGLEFECVMKKDYNKKAFLEIPDIMAIDVDKYEQRYRIPSGLKGMVCLYRISNLLKENSIVDLESSVHIHTDLTDVENYEQEICTTENREYIINQLIEWKTALNLSNKHGWIRFPNPLGTLEIRIGEPTFDYHILIKRVLQCSEITRHIKRTISIEERLEKLNKQLKELHVTSNDLEVFNNYQEIVNNKIIKL